MLRVAIIAKLSSEQLDYIRNLADEHGVDAEFIVQKKEAQTTKSSTPITGEMMDVVAEATNKNVLEIAAIANQYGISTVQEALAHSEVPSSIKEILESYL